MCTRVGVLYIGPPTLSNKTQASISFDRHQGADEKTNSDNSVEKSSAGCQLVLLLPI